MHTKAERENLATVERTFDAFARRDMATVAATFHEKAHWHMPSTGVLKGNYRGRDQILGFFAHLEHETEGSFSTIPVTLAASGSRVFAQNLTTAKRNGNAWTWQVVLVFEFAAGVATSVQEYMLDYPAVRRFWT